MSSPGLMVAAQCLRIDHSTVEVVDAMRVAGVRPILLKGPAVVDLLYRADPTERGYVDIDLLVSPHDVGRAGAVLSTCGYRPLGRIARHAETWIRLHDRSAVDLHTTLHGAERLDAVKVWDAVSSSAVELELLGTGVDVPSVAVRLLHTVLHLRPRDHPGSQAWIDLERAVRFDAGSWRDAAAVARSLGLDDVMGPLLRLVPQGRRLADDLGLPTRWPVALRAEYVGNVGSALFWAHLAELPRRERLPALFEKLVPTPTYLRSGWPMARRGPGGLALVYLYRGVLVPWRLGQAIVSRVRDRGPVVYDDSSGFTQRRGDDQR